MVWLNLHFITRINRESHSLENLQRILYEDPTSVNTFVSLCI